MHGVECKLTLTTACGARCQTCPSWKRKVEIMPLNEFKAMWDKLMASPYIGRILINNTGDAYTIMDHIDYFKYIEEHKTKPVIMTTNAVGLDYVPKIDGIMISFNGYSKDSFEKIVGVSFDRVYNNIVKHSDELHQVHTEIHHLVFDETNGHEREFYRLFKDLPFRMRLSYKYDNQMEVDKTVAKFKAATRIPCDYLTKFNINPNGQLIRCAHDWEGLSNFGNILESPIESLLSNLEREAIIQEHARGEFKGICTNCNYNVTDQGKVFYI